jgi:hypothetical protein
VPLSGALNDEHACSLRPEAWTLQPAVSNNAIRSLTHRPVRMNDEA